MDADGTILLSNVVKNKILRIKTGPWDQVFGGNETEGYGIVRASVILIGGAPGAGKSTLSLQLSDEICEVTQREIIYIAAEEANEPIAVRASRLGLRNANRIRVVPMGHSGDLSNILLTRRPSAIILDSLSGIAKGINEEVEMAEALKDHAVELDAPVLIVDHVNKQEEFAGLMELQHVVDATVSLYPVYDQIREMRAVKNRHGAANVIIQLKMTPTGLVMATKEDLDEDDEDDDDGDNDENDDEDEENEN